MKDELMRRISAAMDSEDGLAADPEVTKALASDPEAAKYARQLARMQRWMASWPLRVPDDDRLEALARSVEARLDEVVDGDFTAPPSFDDEPTGSSPDALGSEPSLVELSLSSITELPDAFSQPEESSATLARLPLKKTKKPSLTEVAALRRVDPRSADHEEPSSSGDTVGPQWAAPTVPRIPSHATHPTAPTPAAGRGGHDAHPAPMRPPAADAPTAGADMPKNGAAPRSEPVQVREVEAAASERAEVSPEVLALEGAQAGSEALGRPPEEERVSFPMPAPTVPRLEPVERRAPAAAPRRKARELRGWAAWLAAAAIGIGVIGAATLYTSRHEPATSSAPAVATVAPSTGAGTEGPVEALAPAVAAAPSPPVAVMPPREAAVGASFSGLAPRLPSPDPAAAPAERSEGIAEAPTVPRRAPAEPARLRAARFAVDDGGEVAMSRSGASAGGGGRASRATGRASGGPGPSTLGASAPASAPPRAPSGPSRETLDRATVQAVMQGVEPAIRACAGERHGTAQIDIVVEGSTGRVTSATVSGSFQGSPEGSCMARAARQARFPTFTGEPIRLRYPVGI